LTNLRLLYLNDNSNLTSLPEEILQLPNNCEIELINTGLSEAVLNSLREAANAPDYNGPRFSISLRENPQGSRSIEAIIQDLVELTEIDALDISNLVADERQKTILTNWLNRLSYISGFQGRGEKHKDLAHHIVSYLQIAQEDSGYQTFFFALIEGAADTCGDNMATSILDLGLKYKELTIPKEDYQSLAKFLGNTKWAVGLLREISRKKVQTLRFVDVIETYLAYQVKLKQGLDLDIPIDDMLYFEHWSNVSEADLETAKNLVLEQRQDKKACYLFLAQQDKWVEALKLHYGSQIEEANAKRYEAFDNGAYLSTLAELTEQLLGEEFFPL